MQVASLCGGLGTRLGDLARDRPKALVPVAGRPFIEHQLDLLRGQGLTLKDFLQITGQTEEELREQYHGRAERRTRSALVFYEFLRQEKVAVSDPDIDAEIERMSASFGEKQAPVFKQYLSSAQNRSNIENDLVTNRGVDLLVAIARGEDIPAPSPAADEQPAAAEETADETDAAMPLDAPEGDEASETAEEG